VREKEKGVKGGFGFSGGGVKSEMKTKKEKGKGVFLFWL